MNTYAIVIMIYHTVYSTTTSGALIVMLPNCIALTRGLQVMTGLFQNGCHDNVILVIQYQ